MQGDPSTFIVDYVCALLHHLPVVVVAEVVATVSDAVVFPSKIWWREIEQNASKGRGVGKIDTCECKLSESRSNVFSEYAARYDS